jgi:multidrug transporter EmrE-like cation transporter
MEVERREQERARRMTTIVRPLLVWIGPISIATVGVWAAGVYAANAVVGILVFGDNFSPRIIAGLLAACATIALLNPSD